MEERKQIYRQVLIISIFAVEMLDRIRLLSVNNVDILVSPDCRYELLFIKLHNTLAVFAFKVSLL